MQHAQVAAIGDLVDLERAIKIARHPGHALVVFLVVLHPHHTQAQHQGHAHHPQRPTANFGPLAMVAQQHHHHHQGAQHQAHRQLVVAVKAIRRNHTDKKAAQKAAHRQHQVVHGQVFAAGLLAGQLAMANHAHHKKGAQVQAHGGGNRPLANAQGGQIRQQPQGQHKQGQPQGAAVPALALKAQDERQQVQGQRRNPQHGNGRDVFGQKAGVGHHQYGRAGGQGHPQAALAPRHAGAAWGSRVGSGGRKAGVGHAMAPAAPGQISASRHKAQEQARPGPRLRPCGQQRLDRQGVGQQGQHRAQVGQGKQAVRHQASLLAGKPGLHQGAGGGQHKVGQTNRSGEQTQDAQGGVFGAIGFPGLAGGDGQQPQARQQQQHMQNALAHGREVAHQPMGIQVTQQQKRLEKQHAGGPHRRRATKPGQDHLAHQGLHLKEQKRAQKNRQGIRQHRRAGRSIHPVLGGLLWVKKGVQASVVTGTRAAKAHISS